MSGEQLKPILTQTGISQKELAEKIGIHPQGWAKIFKSPDIKTGLLEDLCRVLDKKIDFFYQGTDYAPEDTDLTDNEKIQFLKGQITALERTIDRLTRNQPGTLVEEKKAV